MVGYDADVWPVQDMQYPLRGRIESAFAEEHLVGQVRTKQCGSSRYYFHRLEYWP